MKKETTEEEKVLMKIDDNFFVTQDAYNIILNRKVVRTNKKTKEESEGIEKKYYGTLEGCLIAALKYRVVKDSSSVAKILSETKKAKEEIIKAIKEAFPSGSGVSKVKGKK